MDTANVLVVEDDDIVARTIERCLRGNELRVTLTGTGVEGLRLARRHIPELVILDVILPGMDGYTVCREMRADPLLKDVPILFLTAKSKDEDKINGFNAGADDYLSKPFNLDELILRVQAILRRTKTQPKNVLPPSPARSKNIAAQLLQTRTANGGKKIANRPVLEDRCLTVRNYILNTRTFELETPRKTKIRLTPVQFDLLYHLMSHPGEIFSPPRLLDEVWDYPTDAGSPDLVRVHIKNLRERIEVNPRTPKFIETIPGYGYTIRAKDE
ncbi:MAG: response regulator transcription factor [Chloroflexi bacterium]|nr:response regulator transcription factor [Chloroflexota bacterium]